MDNLESGHDTLFKKANQFTPGGVHSPVRSFQGLGLAPRFMAKAKGAYIEDVEQTRYIDFCMSFGPLIFGHGPSHVIDSLKATLDLATTFGAAEPYSLEMASLLCEKIPFVDQVRFVNSGTEATMTALRLARGFTKRNKLVKFNGCYHGHSDSFLIKAGSGLATMSESSSLGVTPGVAEDTIVLELDDEKNLEKVFREFGNEIAAVFIEPLPANYGLLIQRKEFLQKVRHLCRVYDTVLVFDEVISGFRQGFTGMAGVLDIYPDLVTYGKVIGGGLPVGALAGRKEIMEHLAPIGGVYQAGTLSANPLAINAGLATLKSLTIQTYQNLEDNTKKIVNLFNRWFQSGPNDEFRDYYLLSFGSLIWPIFVNESIRTVGDIPNNLTEKFGPLYRTLLEKGIYFSPNAYEIGFVSTAHNQEVIDDLEAKLWT